MNVRAMIGGTLRLVLAGPPLALGAIFTGVARFFDETCLLIEGGGVDDTTRTTTEYRHNKGAIYIQTKAWRLVASPPAAPRMETIDYQRGARVLYASEFDTAAIAELLSCDESNVARWVCAS